MLEVPPQQIDVTHHRIHPTLASLRLLAEPPAVISTRERRQMNWRFWQRRRVRKPSKSNPEDAFPAEVLKLRRDRGVPLPTWYAGPLYPRDGSEFAQQEFEIHREGSPSRSSDEGSED